MGKILYENRMDSLVIRLWCVIMIFLDNFVVLFENGSIMIFFFGLIDINFGKVVLLLVKKDDNGLYFGVLLIIIIEWIFFKVVVFLVFFVSGGMVIMYFVFDICSWCVNFWDEYKGLIVEIVLFRKVVL